MQGFFVAKKTPDRLCRKPLLEDIVCLSLVLSEAVLVLVIVIERTIRHEQGGDYEYEHRPAD